MQQQSQQLTEHINRLNSMTTLDEIWAGYQDWWFNGPSNLSWGEEWELKDEYMNVYGKLFKQKWPKGRQAATIAEKAEYLAEHERLVTIESREKRWEDVMGELVAYYFAKEGGWVGDQCLEHADLRKGAEKWAEIYKGDGCNGDDWLHYPDWMNNPTLYERDIDRMIRSTNVGPQRKALPRCLICGLHVMFCHFWWRAWDGKLFDRFYEQHKRLP